MRRVLIAILILPLLFVMLSPVYSTSEDDFYADENADILDELEKLLEGDLDFDDDFDDYDAEAEERDDMLDEVDILLNEQSRNNLAFDDEDEEDGVADEEMIDIDVYFKMIDVKGGCFKMGDNFGDGHYDEKPVHRVCVDDYSIADVEVTQELWEKIYPFNPSINVGAKNPVEFVSWVDANNFIMQLNERTDRHFRLPTEAEWEFAARGRGKLEQWPGTNDEDGLVEFAWFDFTSMETTHEVKKKSPNLLGIYDMAGNVWEWVYDHYEMGYYATSPSDNPEGPEFSVWRSLRGGSYVDDPSKLRASGRYGSVSARRVSNFGFRLAE